MARITARWKLPGLLKMTAVAIVAFAGGLGGIYFGQVMLGKSGAAEATPGFGPSSSQLEEEYVSFAPGDLFPLENYANLEGDSGSFEQLLGGKASIILFISFGCNQCLELLEFWQENLTDRLLPGIQVIAAIDNESGQIPPEYAGLLKDIQIVLVDRMYWARTYEIILWPTLVGIDGSGFVVHVQPGFGNYIDFELVNFFLKPS